MTKRLPPLWAYTVSLSAIIAYGRAKSGSVAIYVALMLTTIIGFVSLGTEFVYLLYKHRQMQTAVDTAALAGATAQAAGFPKDPATEAKAIMATSGFSSGVSGVLVTVNIPPSNGSYAGRRDAVEVIVDQPQSLTLAALFVKPSFDVSATAVASTGNGQGCVLALDPSASGAVTLMGSATVNLSNCSLDVNSTSPTSLLLGGNASLNTLQVRTAGNYASNGQGQISADKGVTINASPTSDPYANASVPSPGPCLRSNYKLTGNSSATLSPGTYCGGITVGGGSRITFTPGVYVLNGGDLSINGGGVLSGSGVTIVLTGQGTGSVHVASGALVNLSAPVSGPTAGLAIFQDANATSWGSNDLLGGSSQVISGALYFPNQAVNFAGGSVTNACTQLIARTIDFSGNSAVALNCDGVPIKPFGPGAIQLVQ